MLPIPTTRAQEARRYLALHTVLGLPTEHLPRDSRMAALAALCDALSYSDGAEFTLGEIFGLSDRVLLYRDQICDSGEPAIFDVDRLAEREGVPYKIALLAVRLSGAWLDGARWRDDGVGVPTLLTFNTWNSDESSDL